MLKLSLTACAAAICLMAAPKMAAATPAMTSNHAYCSAPAYRQFDFWLGDWDTYRIKDDKPGDVSVARNRVTSMLDGCALHEAYTRNDGYAGESYTSYDASRKVWHQTWVSNQGELNVMEGTQQGDRIVLSGEVTDGQGVQLQRVSWEPWQGGVRETCEGSRDGGKTWTVLFDILFRKHQA
ncbi:hypothetical protein [Dyella mobilis]|uniref:DUF1579 domain-containing protein n=1 Tax=Dyella mobilis TaxID=1849582 RepID=A0ABS2KH59_9GAMM|nr:hypothetical protein [Dyella mobilis]MBM7130258.1 hypothetical protein [Dyella mobilis]GLQ96884.1 hypothetical protein GCM10007863_13040 [Dyella mobilis]